MTTWSSASSRHDSGILHLGESEIADHDLGVFVGAVVEQVLGLQVPVHHAHRVHVTDRIEHLENVGYQFLKELGLVPNIAEPVSHSPLSTAIQSVLLSPLYNEPHVQLTMLEIYCVSENSV